MLLWIEVIYNFSMSGKTIAEPVIKGEDRKIGQILIDLKLVTLEQLAQALYLQKQMAAAGQTVPKLVHILVFQKVLTLPQLQEALRRQTQKAEVTKKLISQAKEELEEQRVSRMKTKFQPSPEEKKGLVNRLSFLFFKKR